MRDNRILTDIGNPQEEVVEKASSVLLSGGLVLYPSDTVYGLLCRADDRDAVARLRELKGYDGPRPFILVVSGVEMARTLTGGITLEIHDILAKYWPGPVTLVLSAGPCCPVWVTAEDGSVALRHPADPLSTGLLAGVKKPLVSTSANLAGRPEPLAPDHVPDSLLAGVDLVLDGGELPPSEPSAVIRPAGGKLEILRSSPDFFSR